MAIHHPPHPGEFLREVCLEPIGLSARQLAVKLGVSPSTFPAGSPAIAASRVSV
jgi:antitoxin HigA-1